MDWIRVYRDGENVVLDVFPMQPGGCTLHLPLNEAEDLARRLREAAGQKESKDERGV